MDLILGILVGGIIILSYILGYNSGMRAAAEIVRKFADDIKKTETVKIPMLIGEQTETDILFRTDSGNFLFQSDSLEKAASHAFNIKINIAAVVLGENKYWFIKGKVFDFEDETVKNEIENIYKNSYENINT